MTDSVWLAGRFEEQRPRLRSVAYRMLGSLAEADDALQESGFGSAVQEQTMSTTWAAG